MEYEIAFNHSFPAVRGIQAGRICYTAMCPLRLVSKLFIFDEDEVPVELRAQRSLNKQRIPEIALYLSSNPLNYTLSALTASISSQVEFRPSSDSGPNQNVGTLSIPMDAKILINDGQHRRAAIELAVKQEPNLGQDHISVLFFVDEGLERSQQMFADLNKHAIRPSDAISTLYDHREIISQVARHLVQTVPLFQQMTDLEHTSISNRSTKLFTISSIKNAAKAFLQKGKKDSISEAEILTVTTYWEFVCASMNDWQNARLRKIAPADLREKFIHAHGVALQAIGQIGPALMHAYPDTWKDKLKLLNSIDWSRDAEQWHRRVLISGRISKSNSSVILTGNLIKNHLGIPLSAREQAEEEKL